MSATTAWRRIQRTERVDIRMGTLITRRMPPLIRVLMLDAKHFVIHRKPHTLYVAFDAEASQPVAWLLLPRYELRLGYDRILSYFRKKKVGIAGVVSDGHVGLVASVHDYYPHAVHQQCAFHALADVLRKLGGRRFLLPDEGRALWQRVRQVALECDTLSHAHTRLRFLRFRYPGYERAWRALHRHLPPIYEFVKLSALADYRTSNRMENFMGVLEQRLKSFRSMKTPDTCIKIVSSLIAEKYKRPTKK